jgi:hypothetical protein
MDKIFNTVSVPEIAVILSEAKNQAFKNTWILVYCFFFI